MTDPHEDLVEAGAALLTGYIAATCCHVTGGSANDKFPNCACREASSAFLALIAERTKDATEEMKDGTPMAWSGVVWSDMHSRCPLWPKEKTE